MHSASGAALVVQRREEKGETCLDRMDHARVEHLAGIALLALEVADTALRRKYGKGVYRQRGGDPRRGFHQGTAGRAIIIR